MRALKLLSHPRSLHRHIRRPLCIALLGAAAAVAPVQHAAASLLWSWSYTGQGIAATGTFTTDDVADSNGFYQITGLTGSRNGSVITGLQATGTSIPGNEPFAVDNLVSLGAQQLTGDGFGFSTADGGYSNPFYADWLSPAGYLDFTVPTPGQYTEDQVAFSANVIPEPQSLALLLAGLGAMSLARRRRQSAH
jgi:hypothetical protein